MSRIVTTLIFLFVASTSLSAPSNLLTGPDLLSGKVLEIHPAKLGTVVVFMSASCPCSHSHVDELKSLASEYKDFHFVAVHSNVDEQPEMSKEYFNKISLNFPVLQDSNAAWADEFKALKTPHSFVISADNKILYQGGVSSSRDLKKAERKFLREALNDIQNHRNVQTPEGRTLGCTISRGENKNVW